MWCFFGRRKSCRSNVKFNIDILKLLLLYLYFDIFLYLLTSIDCVKPQQCSKVI